MSFTNTTQSTPTETMMKGRPIPCHHRQTSAVTDHRCSELALATDDNIGSPTPVVPDAPRVTNKRKRKRNPKAPAAPTRAHRVPELHVPTSPEAPASSTRKSRTSRLAKPKACVRCREKKIKCNEAKPACNQCQQGRLDCQYRVAEIQKRAKNGVHCKHRT